MNNERLGTILTTLQYVALYLTNLTVSLIRGAGCKTNRTQIITDKQLYSVLFDITLFGDQSTIVLGMVFI